DHYFLSPLSETFHGRDIFAPVAAWLAKTYQTEVFGDEISDYVRFTVPKPRAAGETLKGVVLRVDTFGNLMTNLTPDDVPAVMAAAGKIKLQIGNTRIERLARTFAQGAAGEAIALIGSSGYIEVAVNRGHAARTLGVQRGTEVTLELA